MLCLSSWAQVKHKDVYGALINIECQSLLPEKLGPVFLKLTLKKAYLFIIQHFSITEHVGQQN